MKVVGHRHNLAPAAASPLGGVGTHTSGCGDNPRSALVAVQPSHDVAPILGARILSPGPSPGCTLSHPRSGFPLGGVSCSVVKVHCKHHWAGHCRGTSLRSGSATGAVCLAAPASVSPTVLFFTTHPHKQYFSGLRRAVAGRCCAMLSSPTVAIAVVLDSGGTGPDRPTGPTFRCPGGCPVCTCRVWHAR